MSQKMLGWPSPDLREKRVFICTLTFLFDSVGSDSFGPEKKP